MKKIILSTIVLALSACGGGSGPNADRPSAEPEVPSKFEAKKKCLLESSAGTSFKEENPSREDLLMDTVKLAMECNISESDMKQYLKLY